MCVCVCVCVVCVCVCVVCVCVVCVCGVCVTLAGWLNIELEFIFQEAHQLLFCAVSLISPHTMMICCCCHSDSY